MKKRPVLLIVIALNLVVLVALAFVYPHLMVSPGPLVKGHADLTTDCFACHAAWRGASPGRCIECHAVADVIDFKNAKHCTRLNLFTPSSSCGMRRQRHHFRLRHSHIDSPHSMCRGS
ncbi:MAG: hypothetical protein EOO38_10065 [Cytophagaceae bacterium]|nr:MAG: hypothetical protein EOO38_10065 [Cytophagaceae bacterium]